jgi:hypothetical protein
MSVGSIKVDRVTDKGSGRWLAALADSLQAAQVPQCKQTHAHIFPVVVECVPLCMRKHITGYDLHNVNSIIVVV